MLLAAAFARIIFTAIHEGEKRAKRELRLQEVQAIRAECYFGRSLPHVPAIAALVLEISFLFNNCRQNRSSSKSNRFSLKRAIGATSDGPVRIISRDRGL